MKRKIALAQLDIQLGNPAENYQKAKQAIEEAASHHADIVVLPEDVEYWLCLRSIIRLGR